MAGSPKETLEAATRSEEVSDERELYLRDGRTLVVADDLVEIRAASGMVEVRIQLTDKGPVLQMETVRLQLKASEAVEIESPHVEIKGTEKLELSGGSIEVTAEERADETNGEVRIVGKMIYLN
jgi:hypothetical protein